jgi:hypothetical protein
MTQRDKRQRSAAGQVKKNISRLNRLRRDTNSSNYAELIRNALRVYEWFIDAQHKGYEIGLVKDDKLEKVVEFLY